MSYITFSQTTTRRTDDGVQIALNPDELDLDKDAIQKKYEQQLRDSQLQKEDLSDMVADHQAKQAKVGPFTRFHIFFIKADFKL